MTERIPEMFGSLVFNEKVMRERLPQRVYEAWHHTIAEGNELDPSVADAVACAMKDWAVEKGATHYTHWFQPMTGITAEKHEGFLSPGPDGSGILEFSAKALIKGEPDASSFPSGGLRATFEARGYTAWDPTSFAFIKDNSLCIPTVFCSYRGDVLDKKTPLLRSAEALSQQALRILKLFGRNDVVRVYPEVGPEQEYFLIDKAIAKKRKDLLLTGRTLFGARPAKGQEMEDHYYGVIRPRVQRFMEDLNEELWKLGVCAKTEHNEVAPAQHELAPLFEEANRATDHNQLTMELMKKIAERHNMVCLLHEKPFAGVNGSGKHNNWSIATDKGENLFKPGRNPEQNKIFQLMVCAVLKAVDDYQDLLRCTAASASNDLRLGAAEAPPAIISIFLGSRITDILDSLENGRTYEEIKSSRMGAGVIVVPEFKKDTEDRNRTSPMAFTGKKFEFRMLGSNFSVSDVNTVLNTSLAEVLSQFADTLEGAEDFDAALKQLLRETYIAHKRIVFNGNNYADEWVKEAERRGLLNLRSTPDAIPTFISDKNIALFTKHGVLSAGEMHSRYEIQMENYAKLVNIEALTMVEMARRELLPAVFAYCGKLSTAVAAKKAVGLLMDDDADLNVVKKINTLANDAYLKTDILEEAIAAMRKEEDVYAVACVGRDKVRPAMEALRADADQLEMLVAAESWPWPVYEDLMFSV